MDLQDLTRVNALVARRHRAMTNLNRLMQSGLSNSYEAVPIRGEQLFCERELLTWGVDCSIQPVSRDTLPGAA